MRYDEIKTLADCDAYFQQMMDLYSMPKDGPHWEEYLASVSRSVEEKRAHIREAQHYRMRIDPSWRPFWVD